MFGRWFGWELTLNGGGGRQAASLDFRLFVFCIEE